MLVRETQLPVEKSVREIPEGWTAWCHQECGEPVTAIEIWDYGTETDFIGSHITTTPHRHVVPLPCRHDDRPPWVKWPPTESTS